MARGSVEFFLRAWRTACIKTSFVDHDSMALQSLPSLASLSLDASSSVSTKSEPEIFSNVRGKIE